MERTDSNTLARIDTERDVAQDFGTIWRISRGELLHNKLTAARPVSGRLAGLRWLRFLFNVDILLDSLQTNTDTSISD